MGKFLIWLGSKMVAFNNAMRCKWNGAMLALMFKDSDCPNKICNCK